MSIQLGTWLDSLTIPPKRYGQGPLAGSAPVAELNDRLNDWAALAPGAALMVSVMRYLAGGDPFDRYALAHPDDVRQALAGFGLGDADTFEAIHTKALALGNVDLVAYWRAHGYVKHRSNLMPLASYNTLKTGLPLVLACTPDVAVNGGDLVRRLPTLAELQAILADGPSKRYVWQPVYLDCDDHARIMRGWLSQVGLGDIAIAAVEGNMYRDDGSSFSHAWCVAALADGRYVHIEPNDCQIKPDDYAFNGATYNQIYRVEW